jgi:hypothetical protein
VSKIYGLALDRETLDILARAAAQRGVQVFAKVLWGDPARKLTEAVHKVPLQWLVVGNRGLSAVKRCSIYRCMDPLLLYFLRSSELFRIMLSLPDDHSYLLFVLGMIRVLMGSVSTYVVNHAACPITVVRENMLPSALTTSY